MTICPHTCDAPICFDDPICLDDPSMLGCPLYVWIHPIFGCPPVCLDTPVCLGAFLCFSATCMFGCPLYMHNTKKACFVRVRGIHMIQYIWVPPVHKQQKESMFCQNKGESICPHTFGCSHMFGFPLVCLYVLFMFICHHMFDAPLYG